MGREIMAHTSKTFRVFVSSTFSDLKAERDALQKEVFPKLRELCLAHGCRFQAIDLRWGVSEEAARDQQTMTICLQELQRCQQITPRPNFIVLLGDRYGWRPLPPQIAAEEFELLLAQLSPQDQTHLTQWYRRDDNAVPPEYYLLPREGPFAASEVWAREEAALHAILLRAVSEAMPPDDSRRVPYETSATHQEIVHGVLRVPNASEHVFGFFRTIRDVPQDATASDFLDVDAGGHLDAEVHGRQEYLKDTLRHALQGNVHEYEAEWTGSGITTGHLPQLCADVYNALSRIILQQIAQLEQMEPLTKEIADHEAWGQERTRFFTGRRAMLHTIAAYLHSGDRRPLAVWGVGGSGKTALIAQAVVQARETSPDAEVVVRFIGATPDSSNGRALLESLYHQISRRYGQEPSTIPTDFWELVQAFWRRLALATAEKPLILFLDALDQLSDVERARNLLWIPAELPDHVHVVVSTLPGECLVALGKKRPEVFLVALDPMPQHEGSTLLDLWLQDAGRTLQPPQRAEVLSKFAACGLPLYLKLAFEEARRWKSYIDTRETALRSDIPGVSRDLFHRLSSEANHGAILVSRSLGYLAAAKNGLSEDELLEVLSADEALMADFRRRSQKEWSAVDRLPIIIWSRLYFDLEPYLREHAADNATLLTFYHRQLCEVATGNHLAGVDGQDRHRTLAWYFAAQALYSGPEGKGVPNARKLSEMPYQQALGALGEELVGTLTSFDFLQAKITAFGPQPLIDDYDFALSPSPGATPNRVKSSERSFRLIQGALRLSSNILIQDNT
jgi:hypothetical protein